MYWAATRLCPRCEPQAASCSIELVTPFWDNKKPHQQGSATALNATKLFHTLSYYQFHLKIQNVQCFPLCRVSQKTDNCIWSSLKHRLSENGCLSVSFRSKCLGPRLIANIACVYDWETHRLFTDARKQNFKLGGNFCTSKHVSELNI